MAAAPETHGDVRMRKALILPVVISLLMSANPVSAAECSTNTQNIPPLSKALNYIQTRVDYQKISNLRFKRDEGLYVIAYRTVSGTEKVLLIDAATGKEK